jgi:hypothetical protein
VLDEVQEKKEDCAVKELLAGHVPLLVCRNADGEDHHENRAADERDAGEYAQDERETKDGFEERNGVAEGVSDAVWKRRFCHVLCGVCREGAYAVVDADEAVTCEVDAEGDAEERVGEGLVIDSDDCLDALEANRVTFLKGAKFRRSLRLEISKRKITE